MIVRLKDRLIVVSVESETEALTTDEFVSKSDGHVFVLQQQDWQTFRMIDLGIRPDACREPLNVTSRHPDPAIQIISNFAYTPFQLNGQDYASVEGFWQGLKFSDRARRREIAELYGHAAMRAGQDAPENPVIEYQGQRVRVGTFDHWQLIRAACNAKFRQHEPSRLALLATGQRPLTHLVRRDSRTIPGAIMADYWMKIRQSLQKEVTDAKQRPGDSKSAERDVGM